MAADRILIYRLGGLGDTIVAIPAFQLIARSFPDSERRVLTNLPITGKTSLINAILEGLDLVQGYIWYPLGVRNPRRLFDLRKQIRRWMPDVLVYLAAPRGWSKVLRDAIFFKLCGIRRLIGVPYTKRLQHNRFIGGNYYEHEAARLLRCLSSLGDLRLDDPQSWDLQLTAVERERATQALHALEPDFRFIACSIGTQVDVKNWGRENWQDFIEQLYGKHKDYALVFVGSKEEYDDCEAASRSWRGLKLNLCGSLKPREGAAVLKMATIFVGHDGGCMHLAASVGTPCVAIFSARNKPGVWFPYGTQHKVIYHQTDCYGCTLVNCVQHQKECISSISVQEVLAAVDQIL